MPAVSKAPAVAKPKKARKAPAERKVKRIITVVTELPVTAKLNSYRERRGPKTLIFERKGKDVDIKANGDHLRTDGGVTVSLAALEELVKLLQADVQVVENK